ncbi:MAG: Na/Pi cotransporter family protein [Oscillospiraceae bacterium]
MDIFGVFKFLGGIGLFLFGMHVMGDAIAREAGGRLRTVLENMTSSPIKGLLLGTGVSAVIQSSAAASVMVLGFVNSGIMNLRSAVAVIMGANIGTCATAWILSLNSISGDSFFLRLINPDSFVPLLAIIGAMFLLFTKSDRRKDAAYIALGFSVLMYGMNFMSAALAPITGTPEFAQMLTFFSNPFIGILIGFVIAVVTQSSSASIGILQAISAVGAISFSTALPLIIGINIGAMIIVLISSVGGTRDARRAAIISILYNIIGGVVVQVCWSAANSVFKFPLADMSMGYISVALTHTIYKALIAAFQLPFTGTLIKLSRVFVPEGEEEEKFQMLDERFLKTPSLAVGRCTELTREMGETVLENINNALSIIESYDEAAIRRVSSAEDLVDKYEDKLGTYMAKLSGTHMNPNDSRELSRLLHCIGDFERISDHALNISEAAQEKQLKGLHFSKDAQAELRVMYAAVRDIVDMTVRAFVADDEELAKHVEPLEEVIDELTDQMKARHIARLQRGECTTLLGFVLQDLITDFERVADHCSNIAICIIQVKRSTYDAHIYINTLMASDDADFRRDFAAYQRKYALP